jgi:hypothetical protein
MKPLFMSFSTAINALNDGYIIYREGWNGKNIFVFKQVPATIASEVVPKMTSLHDAAKTLIADSDTKGISYENQCLIYNTKTGVANSWVPSSSDMFANDWHVLF